MNVLVVVKVVKVVNGSDGGDGGEEPPVVILSFLTSTGAIETVGPNGSQLFTYAGSNTITLASSVVFGWFANIVDPASRSDSYNIEIHLGTGAPMPGGKILRVAIADEPTPVSEGAVSGSGFLINFGNDGEVWYVSYRYRNETDAYLNTPVTYPLNTVLNLTLSNKTVTVAAVGGKPEYVFNLPYKFVADTQDVFVFATNNNSNVEIPSLAIKVTAI